MKNVGFPFLIEELKKDIGFHVVEDGKADRWRAGNIG